MTGVTCRGLTPEELDALRTNTRTGRPTGSEAFISDLEMRLGRRLRPAKPGRKPKECPDSVEVTSDDFFT